MITVLHSQAPLGQGWLRLDHQASAARRVCLIVLSSLGVFCSGMAQVAVSTQTISITISNDLKAIGVALHNYRDVYGSFPPAYLVDANGQPMVSWRVLILPFLQQQALFERFDLSKSWNDPVNLPLLKQMPDAYRGTVTGQGVVFTSYAGVAGPREVFQGGGVDFDDGIRYGDIVDGTSNTIGVGPVATSALIPWTAPLDIEIEQQPALGIHDGFRVPGQATTPMLFMDGSVRALPNTTSADLILALSTIAGMEIIP